VVDHADDNVQSKQSIVQKTLQPSATKHNSLVGCANCVTSLVCEL